MNRRSFFGFSCGGIIAAPLALVGESASGLPVPRRLAVVGHCGPELVNLPKPVRTITIKIDQSAEKLGFVVDEMPASPVYWTKGKKALIRVSVGDDGTFIL